MSTRVIVLNGGSSSGKTTLARRLQSALPGEWMLVGIDHFIWTLPPSLWGDPDGITFTDGVISVGSKFRALTDAYRRGVAALGVDLIVDEVFLRGGEEQEEWRAVLGPVPVMWVGVHCSPDEAERRNIARGDRMPGTARDQALRAHRGVTYDVGVDTEKLSPDEAAQVVVATARDLWGLTGSGSGAPSGDDWRSPWPRADGTPGQTPWESG